jgi:hypothetical protein
MTGQKIAAPVVGVEAASTAPAGGLVVLAPETAP